MRPVDYKYTCMYIVNIRVYTYIVGGNDVIAQLLCGTGLPRWMRVSDSLNRVMCKYHSIVMIVINF